MGLIDPRQLGGFFDRYAAELVLYARQWLDSALAEDAVQDAFVKLISRHRQPDNVRAWLFRVVRNGSVSQIRRLKSRKQYVQQARQGQVSWFESRLDDLIDAKKAQQTLESLPIEQREVVMLRIWGQMSFSEIADIVSRPISTVHSRYQAALTAVKKKMELYPKGMIVPGRANCKDIQDK